MEIRSYHWLLALLIATLLHGAFALWLISPKERPGVSGVSGLEINLGAVTVAGEMSPVVTEVESVEVVETVEGVAEVSTDEHADVVVARTEPIEPLAAVPETVTPPRLARSTKSREIIPSKPKPVKKIESVVKLEPKLVSAKPVESKLDEPTRAANTGTAGNTTVAKATEPGSSSGNATTPDAGVAEQSRYYLELAAWLDKHKRYPRRARQRQQEGTVKLRFTIDHNGHVLAQNVVGSSGHRLLDREAEQLLKRASPLPPIPGGFSQASLSITVPISFSLR